jgi:outer membrane protein TolC
MSEIMRLRFHHRLPLLLTAILLFSGVCISPEIQAAENLLSLYHKAVQYDAQYKAATANTEAEREEINKARALFLPRVQFGANVGHGVTDRTTQTMGGPVESKLNYDIQNYSLQLRQSLFNKESMASYRSVEANIKSKEALLLKENSTLITRLAAAYRCRHSATGSGATSL